MNKGKRQKGRRAGRRDNREMNGEGEGELRIWIRENKRE